MGFFSFNCKECDHPLLSSHATDAGINDWMTQAVVLTDRGDRFVGEYDGYGSVGGGDCTYGGACLHAACWELAGRPEYDRYGSGSESAQDQGFFFDDGAHDLIDPRITDEAERAELLRKGVEARSKRRYDQKARDVYEWVNDEDEDGQDPWERRFSVHQNYEDGKPVENSWWVEDRLHGDKDAAVLTGTKSDAKAELAREWAEFVKSEEAQAFLARAEEMKAESRARYIADLKEKGRYETSYGPSKVGGDTVGDWRASRQLYRVQDKLTYEDVAVFDYEGEVQSFDRDEDYQGNNSPAWEARVEENRAEARARRDKADAEAKRLNAAWAAEGYPVPEGGIF